jgi:hypothetical protein
MTWDWLKKKTTWAAAAGVTSLAGTCFAFYVDAHPGLKAGLAFLTGVCGILEAAFVASRVTSENEKTREAVKDQAP